MEMEKVLSEHLYSSEAGYGSMPPIKVSTFALDSKSVRSNRLRFRRSFQGQATQGSNTQSWSYHMPTLLVVFLCLSAPFRFLNVNQMKQKQKVQIETCQSIGLSVSATCKNGSAQMDSSAGSWQK